MKLDIWDILVFVAAIVAFMLVQTYLRGRNPRVGHQQVAQYLLLEVRLNLALAESFHVRKKPKKFEVASWQRFKTRVNFLDGPAQVALSDAYTIAEDFNQQIEAIKKHRIASDTTGIKIDRLKEPLAKSRQGLEEWFLATIGTREPPIRYPTIWDTFFGDFGRKD